jgi:hypothetical protein
MMDRTWSAYSARTLAGISWAVVRQVAELAGPGCDAGDLGEHDQIARLLVDAERVHARQPDPRR